MAGSFQLEVELGSARPNREGMTMVRVRIRKRLNEEKVYRNIEDIPLAAEDLPPDYEGEGNHSPDGRIATNEPITIVYEPKQVDEEMQAIQDKFDRWIGTLAPKHKAELRAVISKRICPRSPTMQSLIALFRKWSAASKGELVKEK